MALVKRPHSELEDEYKFVLKEEATYRTRLIEFHHEVAQSTILPNGDIAIWGRTLSDWGFHLFNSQGQKTGQITTEICKDYLDIYPLYIPIGKEEHLAIACWGCKKIRLINLQHPSNAPILAYTPREGNVGPICRGPERSLYVVDIDQSRILVLDCTTTKFTLERAIPFKHGLKPKNICYLDTDDIIVLCSFNGGSICAINSDGGQVWEVPKSRGKNEIRLIDNMDVHPSAMMYLPDRKHLLVADYPNGRILLLDGRTGQWMQTISHENRIRNFHKIGSRLCITDNVKLTFYSTTYKPVAMPEDISLVTLAKRILGRGTEPNEAYRGTCPMTMQKNWKTYIATVSHGESKILRSPESSASLKILSESAGVFLMRVHTEPSRFSHALVMNECICGPCMELEHIPFVGQRRNNPHIVRFPHCATEKEFGVHLKLRRGDINLKSKFLEIQPKNANTKDEHEFYEVGENYVEVHANRFGHYTLTTSKYNCVASLRVFLFGRLEHLNEINTVKLKAFLCSNLYGIEDFKQALLDIQGTYKMKLVAESVFTLGTADTDIAKTRVSIKLVPVGPAVWEPEDTDDPCWHGEQQAFVKCKKLSRMMHMEGPHACRSPHPMAAMTTEMFTRTLGVKFEGAFQLRIERKTEMPEMRHQDKITEHMSFSVQ